MEQPSLDPVVMEQAFQAAAEIGIPIVNCGPGGKSNDEQAWSMVRNALGKLGADGGAVRCESVRKSPRRMQYLQHTNNPSRHG